MSNPGRVFTLRASLPMTLGLAGLLALPPAGVGARDRSRAGDRPLACDDEGWSSRLERHCEIREMTLPAGPLEVDAAPNGGIQVRGEARSDVRVRAKVVAQAPTLAAAQRLAAEVRIETKGVVRAIGPQVGRDEGFWVSYELIVPERAELRLETTNGGVVIRSR